MLPFNSGLEPVAYVKELRRPDNDAPDTAGRERHPFAFLWHEDLLSRPYVAGGCVLVGVAGQLIAPIYSMAWFAAAILNVGVAIYLAIRLKLSM